MNRLTYLRHVPIISTLIVVGIFALYLRVPASYTVMMFFIVLAYISGAMSESARGMVELEQLKEIAKDMAERMYARMKADYIKQCGSQTEDAKKPMRK